MCTNLLTKTRTIIDFSQGKATKLAGTSPTTFTYTPKAAGTFYFGCSIANGGHCKAKQKLTLTVTAAAPGTTKAATTTKAGTTKAGTTKAAPATTKKAADGTDGAVAAGNFFAAVVVLIQMLM